MVRLKHNTVFSEQRKLDRVNTRAWQESLTHSTFKLHLPQCSKCVMFPVKPLLLLFRWGGWIPMQLLPAVLTCPVLSCPVLSCPVLSIMPLAALAHLRQSHRDLSCRCPPERQRALSASTRQSLCASVPLAQPGFGSVNPLLFSPPPSLSLSRGTRRGSPPVHPP